ncbi:hypothetical protein KY289_030139 [Solanum tuberosum]|nr:hypothetical protein KY289_030139 [Solanum tuberosum]
MKTTSNTTNGKTLAKIPNLETNTQKEVTEDFPKLKSPVEGLGTATVGKGKKSEGNKEANPNADGGKNGPAFSLAARGMDLCYVPPILIDGEKVIQLQKQEFEAETEKWK